MMNTIDNKVNAMFTPNDRLGVEIMGPARWNRLKANVANRARVAVARGPRPSSTVAVVDPLANTLFGFNDAAGVEMLGGWWTDLKKGVSSATHTALNAGANIPITSGLVSTIRDVGSYFKWGSKASNETDSAIDAAAAAIKANKVKTALILGGVGVGAALMVYYLGKRKH